MARRLRIVIVSFVDDNFGDILIRISFQGLLDVALQNHGLAADDYELVPMSLKGIDAELLTDADAIFFAGGGLFGLSYLDFFRHVEEITAIADSRDIPVVFSSMGLNNMGAENGSVDAIRAIVRRPSVKAIAVRENLPLFRELVTDLPFEVSQIADPAVWTKHVYGMTDVVPDGTLGINVVRGGLFEANDRKWGLTAEMAYLSELLDLSAGEGLSTRLYTNGSLDDNNTLRFFARENQVPADQVILPQTTREVVEAIASRSAIASIRMHSSIIAYSFGIPSIALEWNDKLPHFYEAIGHPERVIPFGEWTGARSFDLLRSAGTAPEQDPGYRDYLMTTYEYIHRAVGEHVLRDDRGATPSHGFDEVADALVRRAHVIDEDENDLRFKIGKAERAYLGRFITLRSKEKRISSLTKESSGQAQKVEDLSKKVDALTAKVAAQTEKIGALNEKVRMQKRELDMRFSTRVARRLRRLLGR
ncbi:polysaccharide pyruvyl transferase family protein [Microbacterium phyllosphaerae]|uniref:polysaccharide pyruvyl transferase family protein n=1 Tax=Microbacterium phyllosphaerae TaxID=124798 RepID=UPI00216A1E92|nr:polysaccharide pyruvyl transferase family protein [Microbacterium phyllosphaerae]MCS3443279.1 putative coiled-coil protein SlyX [Microbacterium phyllosphaerae]